MAGTAMAKDPAPGHPPRINDVAVIVTHNGDMEPMPAATSSPASAFPPAPTQTRSGAVRTTPFRVTPRSRAARHTS